VNFHYAFGRGKWFEPELLVQRVCISGSQHYATEALQVGMLNYLFHEAQRQAFAPMLWEHINVGEVRERCLIGYDAGKAYLLTLKEKAKTQGIGYRTLDDGAWNAGRPVRLR
jgi:hypothetical protein